MRIGKLLFQLSSLFVFGMLFGSAMVKAQTDDVQVPAGVHYKKANDKQNQKAKDALAKALASKETPDAEFFSSAVSCGPGLWDALASNAEKELQDSVQTNFVVFNYNLPGRAFSTGAQKAAFWKAVLNKYPQLASAVIRKAKPEEIQYFWDTIPFDIEEPLFAIEANGETFIVNITMDHGKPALFWLDRVVNLHVLGEKKK